MSGTIALFLDGDVVTSSNHAQNTAPDLIREMRVQFGRLIVDTLRTSLEITEKTIYEKDNDTAIHHSVVVEVHGDSLAGRPFTLVGEIVFEGNGG